MELITFQTWGAFQELISKEYLVTNPQYINVLKSKKVYEWIIRKMDEKIKDKPKGASYPLWAWVQYGKRQCPPKHKTLGYFAPNEDILVKITFHKNEEELLLTNFNLFSFLLNNRYIPINKKEYLQFEKRLKENNITYDDLKAYMRPDKFLNHRQDKEYMQIIKEIQKSFDLILNPGKDRIQACFWKLNVSDIIQVEFIHRKDCVPRNYKVGRNYINEYIHKLTD